MLSVLLLLSRVVLSLQQKQQAPIQPAQSCSHPELSCQSPPPDDPNTCCYNHPSGHFLQTQFWDASPALGPKQAWTVHGLWPDLCTGGFEQFCDSDRSVTNVTAALEATSADPDLHEFMSKYWLSLNGDNNHLWAHEWNKHGTCISTLDAGCYGSHQSPLSAVRDYFTHAAAVYMTRPTWDILKARDITPSHGRTYSRITMEQALSFAHGADVTLRCHGSILQEVWYHYRVEGPLRGADPFDSSEDMSKRVGEQYMPVPPPDRTRTNCPASHIRYLPKDSPAPTNTHITATATETSKPSSTPSKPFTGKGHLLVRIVRDGTDTGVSIDNDITGCLIRSGQWYRASGQSCATYIAKEDANHFSSPEYKVDDSTGQTYFDTDSEELSIDSDDDDHLFTLSSLYSPCAVLPGSDLIPVAQRNVFMCGKYLGVQGIFSMQEVAGFYVLAYHNDTTFFAERLPEKFDKVDLFSDDDGGAREVEVEITWEAL